MTERRTTTVIVVVLFSPCLSYDHTLEKEG